MASFHKQAQLEAIPTSLKIKDYWDLLKPKVIGLVIFTSFCGCLLSPFPVHTLRAAIGILAVAMAAGASGCLNQWYEAKTDALMQRTKNRPVASGRISNEASLAFGLLVAVLSLFLMQAAYGLFQSLFLLFTIVYYSYFYTVILKPNTEQNIVIGGAAGAFPPVIGYSFGGSIDIYAWILFLIIFMWTPTHFWALSLNMKKDYKDAGIPILPNTKGNFYTKKMILCYAVLTTLASFVPLFLRPSSLFLWISFSLLNIFWIYLSYSVLKNKTKPIKLFLYSIVYLFLQFLLLGIFHSRFFL